MKKEEVCPGCKGDKKPLSAFCKACLYKLPRHIRYKLGSPEKKIYDTAVWLAVMFLEDNK